MRIRTFVTLIAAWAGCWPLHAVFAADQLPPGPNRDLIYGRCRTCHDLTYLTDSAGISRADWSSILDSMRQLGLPELSKDDRKKILDYLATYLGPHPPAATTTAQHKQPAQPVNGATLFTQQCVACHQSNGQGVPGQFPPLAGNSDLFLSRDFPVLVDLNGMQGSIEAGGKSFNGTMPSFSYLSDQQIAALATYVRSAWGNSSLRPAGMAKIDAATVKAARAKPMTATAVHDYRASLKK
jgi:mono/diheme cytochrome c family protein